MAIPLPDSIKNVIPSLEKATEISSLLLFTNFVLLADCATLYVHGMNILHLSEVPDIIQPRLAIEATILLVVFGAVVSIVMLIIYSVVECIVKKARSNLDRERAQIEIDCKVSILQLREKAHSSKENYYYNLFKDAKFTLEKEQELRDQMKQTSVYAFTVLVLSAVNLCVPLSPSGNGVLAQIADGAGRPGCFLLIFLGCILVILALYPMFEDYHSLVDCPELARETGEKQRQEREQETRFRQEAEKRNALTPRPAFNDVGKRMNANTWGRPRNETRKFLPDKLNE